MSLSHRRTWPVGATVTVTSVFGMATVCDGSDDGVSGRRTSRGIEMHSLLRDGISVGIAGGDREHPGG